MPKCKNDEGDKPHKRMCRWKRPPLTGMRHVLIR